VGGVERIAGGLEVGEPGVVALAGDVQRRIAALCASASVLSCMSRAFTSCGDRAATIARRPFSGPSWYASRASRPSWFSPSRAAAAASSASRSVCTSRVCACPRTPAASARRRVTSANSARALVAAGTGGRERLVRLAHQGDGPHHLLAGAGELAAHLLQAVDARDRRGAGIVLGDCGSRAEGPQGADGEGGDEGREQRADAPVTPAAGVPGRHGGQRPHDASIDRLGRPLDRWRGSRRRPGVGGPARMPPGDVHGGVHGMPVDVT
jgi:hypothetical protein